MDYTHVKFNCKIPDLYCEQPLKIKYFYNDDYVESIFDMWIRYYDNYEEFVEVKYTKELDPQNLKSKRAIRQITVQSLWCQDNNFGYKVQTEKSIRSNSIYLNNLKHICMDNR
ncbi:MAG: TnsA endonuclease N-terminal domain-containing protein [Bacillota bacterium]